MRKFLILGFVVLAVASAAAYYLVKREEPAAAADQAQAGPGGGQRGAGGAQGQRGQGPGGPGGGGFGGPGGGGGFRPPMTVEVTKVSRGSIAAHLSIVGNLIGAATVEVAPKAGGRLQSVSVKLGDHVRRGQTIAKVEDREMQEQVVQAEASHAVSEATIRSRQADLKLAETSVERSRNLFARQLLPRQTLDDAEARYAAAQAQLDLANAQLAQNASRLKELRINLANTTVSSPVDGFVSQRLVDPGAWVSQNAPVVTVVDISSLRLVANIVEKDIRLLDVGDPAQVKVDAYPGEVFKGRIARVSPILDPATRTAAMEIEVPNPGFRLKPGMYATVNLEVEGRENVLIVPKVSLVDSEGQRGIYQPNGESRAQFKPVKVGIEDTNRAEILEGLTEGETVVSTGAGALRRNDQLLVAGAGGGQRGPGGPGGPGRPGAGGTRQRGTNPPSEGPSGSGQQPGRRPQTSSQLQQRPIA
jgi:RND family efflux transporter MFP subunit